MRTLAPWGGTFRREMERFFDRFVEPVGEPCETLGGEWVPRLDVAETKDAVIVKAEMPGVEAKDIAVTLMGDLLTLKGERERATEDKEERYLRMERTYGTFLRTVRLPMAVDGAEVTAVFKSGVFVVTLPKTPAAEGTFIPIKEE